MQLTDSEIREILIREKRRKRMRKRRQRSIAMLVILCIIVLIAVLVKIYGSDGKGKTDIPTRGAIFIDPGHGGGDPGSDNGVRYEKEDVLSFSLAVKACLEDSGFKVHLSRDTDTDVGRAERLKMAEDSDAKLLISFHRNKSQTDNEGSGVEIFIPHSNTGESRLLAENIMKALVSQGFSERTIRAGQYLDETADYDEIATEKMPACLAEVGFINSDTDNSLFDGKFNENAEAVAGAIDVTFKTLYESE